MKRLFFAVISILLAFNLHAQDSTNISKKVSKKEKLDFVFYNKTKHALEMESLFPMFFTGGFHLGIGYRYNNFRVRVSVINGGSYNAETAGIHSSKEFNRYYKTSPGLFLGYNVWKNLEFYTYLEYHTYEIKQKSTGIKKDLRSFDFGGGVGYPFFLWQGLYVQPAFHVYIRKSKSLDFDGATYNIPNVDLSPVIRIGYRFWSK